MPKIERRHTLVLHQLIQGGIFLLFQFQGGIENAKHISVGHFFVRFLLPGDFF